MPRPHISEVQGVIFDVDDTLLDNNPRIPIHGLHERSRLAAVHEVGKRKGIETLTQFTPQENLDAFLTAKVHTLDAAVWNILVMAGLVADGDIDPSNELLQEIVRRKNDLHEDILRSEGKEVPGASAFVRAVADTGLKEKLAIASTAVRRDIDIFLEISGLRKYFPETHIITREQVVHPKPHPQAYDLAISRKGRTAGAAPA